MRIEKHFTIKGYNYGLLIQYHFKTWSIFYFSFRIRKRIRINIAFFGFQFVLMRHIGDKRINFTIKKNKNETLQL